MNKKGIISKINIWMILSVIWMAIIFSMSSRVQEKSTNDSYSVGMMIGKLTVSGFDELSYEKQIEFAEKIDHPVRKSAHGIEYALLGVLLYMALKSNLRVLTISDSYRYNMSALFAWLITTVYAASDEIHQLFVKGRSGQISDVLLDSLGAIIGIAIMVVISRLITIIRRSGKSTI